jgi:NAD-dependent dihydropyrimidine dehydrogenase PreA subunit
MAEATSIAAVVPATKITVVVSRVPADVREQHGPALGALELALEKAGVAYTAVDSFYDMHDTDPGVAYLRGIANDLVVLGWHYPKAIKWILARHDLEVNGNTRKLHCLDVRDQKPEAIVMKVQDILAGRADAVIARPAKARGKGQKSTLTPEQKAERNAKAEAELAPPENAKLSPRWYPVVDYDQCTNCMECMDFCLFGVYGVDGGGMLRVLQQDQCRQDCPACSRVCPVGAIVFPKYLTNQSIAGSDEGGDRGDIKLDLSAIFGKPKGRHQAALERDRELIKAGRKAVGSEKVEKLADQIDKLEL